LVCCGVVGLGLRLLEENVAQRQVPGTC
jgi:hypothetical protein